MTHGPEDEEQGWGKRRAWEIVVLLVALSVALLFARGATRLLD